jgi:signal transduction histidine kinase
MPPPLLARLLDMASGPLLALDRDHRILFINRRGAEMAGASPASLIGADWIARMVSPDQQDHMRAVYRTIMAGQIRHDHSMDIELGGGQQPARRMCFFIETLVDEQGRIVGALCSGADAADQLRSDEERRDLRRQLLEAQRMEAIGNLAGAIAHDFNNLLTAIKGYSQLLAVEMDADDPRLVDVREIEMAANRATALTRQLLLFSHREAPRMDSVDCAELVRGMRGMLERLVGEDIRLAMDPLADGCIARADPRQIEQIVMNLVVNARDSMPRGGTIMVRVEPRMVDDEVLHTDLPDGHGLHQLSSRRGETVVQISVADTGTGIPAECLPKLLEPFFTTKHRGKGTGLGLSVVNNIVQQHHGGLGVRTEIGKGSRFSVFLPAATASDAAPENKKALAPPEGRGESVLLVEDERSVREVAVRFLNTHGYAVRAAESLREAFDLMEEPGFSPALVFSDMVLPDGTGLDLLREISQQRPGLPILLTSGYSDEKAHRVATQGMGIHLIHKPYELDELLWRFRKALDA